MLGMVAGEGSDSIGTEEFVLVEHDLQHPPELVFAQDRGEPAAPVTDLDRVMDIGSQFWTRLEEPAQTLA